jgi:hypothetical protein
MAPDEPSGARPAGPVVLRIKLRYDDVEAMIARFAVNVGKTGLFLPTKSIQPVGTELKFELRIATDQPVLIGVGRVKAARPPDPDDPGAAYGMAVELMRVTRESRELILKMLERRKQLGLLELGLPMPADVDAARRAEVMESGIRDAGSGAVPMVTPVLESAPVLTAPRRTTGPMAVAKVATIEPLAPETPRKKRVPVADLIASASGPIAAPQAASIDGLDDNIDVGAALARARILATGTDLDGELEALRDSAAAPLEIGIEAASAELARQLGGSAVSKSARWAPPPPTSQPTAQIADASPEPSADAMSAPPIADPVAPEPAATEIEPPRDTFDLDVRAPEPIDEPPPADDAATPVGAQPTPPSEDEDEPALFSDRRFVDAAIGTDPAAPMIHDEADPSDFEEAHEVDPEQIHDEVHRLSDNDIEELENTQIGEMPAPEPDIADRLDQQLDEAEHEDMGFEGTLQRYSDEQSPFDPSLEAALVAAASAEAVDGDEAIEEIEDFEILAEADAEDADLMNAVAEQDVRAASQPPAPEDMPSRPSFLNRLSLDEESGYHPPAPAHFDDEFAHEPGPVDPRILSAGYALSAFDGDTSTPDPDQDFNAPGTYTPVPTLPPESGFEEDFDAPHGNYSGGIAQYVRQDAFDQSDVIAIPPQPRSAAQQRVDDEDFPDLESALEALDVDLDDINDPSKASGMPRAVAGVQRRRSASMVSQPTEDARAANVRKQPGGRVHKRATTEDGIVIDFDDEDE